MKITKFLVFFISLFGFINHANATHNRAGEIRFEHVEDLKYNIYVYTYTELSSQSADRCTLNIKFGDNTVDTIKRINGDKSLCTGIPGAFSGVDIGVSKYNIYMATHTFPGPGEFKVSVEDPNRVRGIQNIPNSVDVPFYLVSTLIIDPETGPNNSPILRFRPLDNGCIEIPYEHNPGAQDPDGDSLVYSLSVCYGKDGKEISGYRLPDQVPTPSADNNISIDPISGLLSWDSPKMAGEYNVCILIEEYRTIKSNGKTYHIKVGDMLRDMQITIENCNNELPIFGPMPELCVVAGDSIFEIIKAYDNEDVIDIKAVGKPFEFNPDSAQFLPAPFTAFPSRDSLTANFIWNTTCEHVKRSAYEVILRLSDREDVPDDHIAAKSRLVNYESFFIKVVAPKVEKEYCEPIKNRIDINWAKHSCNNAVGYKIYRRIDSINYQPPECVTGVPKSTGYSLLATTNSYLDTSYSDTSAVAGNLYCYLITAIFKDGAESFPSAEICTSFVRVLPFIKRVSVVNTDFENGVDTIEWGKPTSIQDTQIYPPPYFYKLFRFTDGAKQLVYLSPLDSNHKNLDTVFVDNSLNTEFIRYSYEVELHCKFGLVGKSENASSQFLSIKPADRKLFLEWNADVPWLNKEYVIYRFHKSSNSFVILDTVIETHYLDSRLFNDQEYCYYIKAIDYYSLGNYPDKMINLSQVSCAMPIDSVPPCPPDSIYTNADCDLDQTYVSWNAVQDSCGKDIAYYNVYFTSVLGGEYEFLEEITAQDELNILREKLESLAGCYYITSVDSAGNESTSSERVCVDNCETYRLPNVFTPGGDNYNDFFVPFPYKYVESIDMKIYNRWGELVFETTDPNILWDGVHKDSRKHLSSGVYYYSCTVNEIRLTGIVPRLLQGTVHIFNQKNINTKID